MAIKGCRSPSEPVVVSRIRFTMDSSKVKDQVQFCRGNLVGHHGSVKVADDAYFQGYECIFREETPHPSRHAGTPPPRGRGMEIQITAPSPRERDRNSNNSPLP